MMEKSLVKASHTIVTDTTTNNITDEALAMTVISGVVTSIVGDSSVSILTNNGATTLVEVQNIEDSIDEEFCPV
ncbi:hypothetical protein M5689_013213 [Euphorbia peplus]|nr:hypothetical protein M5689_013213 [Euphorbia peplus]